MSPIPRACPSGARVGGAPLTPFPDPAGVGGGGIGAGGPGEPMRAALPASRPMGAWGRGQGLGLQAFITTWNAATCRARLCGCGFPARVRVVYPRL